MNMQRLIMDTLPQHPDVAVVLVSINKIKSYKNVDISSLKRKKNQTANLTVRSAVMILTELTDIAWRSVCLIELIRLLGKCLKLYKSVTSTLMWPSVGFHSVQVMWAMRLKTLYSLLKTFS